MYSDKFSQAGTSEGGNVGGNDGNTDIDNENDNTGWLSNIFSSIGNILSAILDLPLQIVSGIGDFLGEHFSNLFEFIGNILEAISPIPTAIIEGLGGFFTNIISYLNPFSENFFGYKLISLLGDLLKNLFVPSEDYLSNQFYNIKNDLENKLSYTSYIDLLEILEIDESGENISISLSDYSISTGINVSLNNFIDFSIFDEYKNVYFSWIRGFTFVFLIIYNINQVYKLIRGHSLITFSTRGKEE